jgi:hypothetical protein
MTITSEQKQKKIRENFRKAEQLRPSREAREQAELVETAAKVPQLQRSKRALQDQVHSRMRLPIPEDFYTHILERAAAEAALELMHTIHAEMASEPFFPAIKRVAEAMWMGTMNMSIIEGGTVEVSLLEQVWDHDNYKFTLELSACRIDRIIDRRELRNMREFGRAEYIQATPWGAKPGDRVVLDTPDVRSYRNDI